MKVLLPRHQIIKVEYLPAKGEGLSEKGKNMY